MSVSEEREKDFGKVFGAHMCRREQIKKVGSAQEWPEVEGPLRSGSHWRDQESGIRSDQSGH